MKRMIIIGVAVVAVLAVGGVVLLYSSLGSIIVAAVEKYGSQMTQTKVTLKSADVSGTTGEGALRGLVIGNPQGFSTPSAFRLGEVKLRLDIGSVTGSTVLIHELGITGPEITYELGPQGGDNISAIRRNIAGKAATDKSAPKPAGGAKSEEKKGDEKKLIIETLYVRDAKMTAAVAALAGKSLTTTLPTIQLKDIGKAKGGVTPAEAADEVMAALTRQVQAEVSKMGIDQVKGLVGSGATDLLNKASGAAGGAPANAPKGAGDMFNKMLGK